MRDKRTEQIKAQVSKPYKLTDSPAITAAHSNCRYLLSRLDAQQLELDRLRKRNTNEQR